MKEFEKRGPLNSNQLIALRTFLEKNAEQLKSESEKVVFFETKEIKTIGDFKNGSARISLKCDPKGNYLRIKEGNPSDNIRSEYAVKLNDVEDVKNMIYILSRIGLTHGFYRPTDRIDYKYGNIVVSIKTNCVMGDHFEIELIDENSSFDVETKELLANNVLDFWTTEEYKSRISNLMTTNPAINILESYIY